MPITAMESHTNLLCEVSGYSETTILIQIQHSADGTTLIRHTTTSSIGHKKFNKSITNGRTCMIHSSIMGLLFKALTH
jgi:hypothetical protein